MTKTMEKTEMTEMTSHEYFEALPAGPGVKRLAKNTCGIIDLEVVSLRAGETFEVQSGDRELAIVLLTGTANVRVGKDEFTDLGGRVSIFEELPTTVYAPHSADVLVTAVGDLEFAVCSARVAGTSRIEPYVVRPEDITPGTWGSGSTERNHRLILTDDRPSERMYLAEVWVEDGRWATYPPHKHETNAADGSEVFQEEMYYYRTNPAQGIGLCALYGGKVGADNAFVIRDRTVHKMPYGYHTLTAAPGYRVWYLAVYAGESKAAKPFVDPDHAWYVAK